MKTRKPLTTLHCLMVLMGLGCHSVVTHADSGKVEWLAYAPSKVSLEGVLVIEEKYGPPNYGENPTSDKKVHIYVLRLNQPINVKADSGDDPNDFDTDSFSDIREVQLIQMDNINLEKYVGKKIDLYGVLFEKENANHYTDVLMDVERILPGSK